jgi:hypothetical protein
MLIPAFKALMSQSEAGVPPASYTLRDSEEDDDGYNSLGGNVSGATMWVAGYSGTWEVKRTAFKGYRSNDTTSDTVTMEIWSDDSGPDTRLGYSDSVTKTSIPLAANLDWVTFDWTTGCDVTAGTTYWMVLRQSGMNANLYWERDADGNGTTVNTYWYSNDGTAWSVLADYQRNCFRAYTLD